MTTQIELVTSRAQLRRFIRLPYRLHRHHPRWVPPLLRQERQYYDNHSNPAFQKNAVVLALASRNGTDIGRIMGIVLRCDRDRPDGQCARFSGFECINDSEVAAKLLRFVEHWAAEKGSVRVVGPMGFTDQDPEGFLVDGFAYEPTISTYYNFEFIPQLLETNGYTKEVDFVVYRLNPSAPIPNVYQKISDRACRNGGFKLIHFESRRSLKPHIVPILSLMNETFVDLYGYLPLTEEEMHSLARQFLPIIDPRFVKVAMKGEQLAAFILAMPNLDEGFRRAHGHLLPTGWWRLMAAARKSTQLDLLMAGVKKEYRGNGLDVLGMVVMIEAARKAGFQWMDSHHELEANWAVRSVMEHFGGELSKRYRIYGKTL
jgi:hypothetical protein